jgi:hypothetical protein
VVEEGEAVVCFDFDVRAALTALHDLGVSVFSLYPDWEKRHSVKGESQQVLLALDQALKGKNYRRSAVICALAGLLTVKLSSVMTECDDLHEAGARAAREARGEE